MDILETPWPSLILIPAIFLCCGNSLETRNLQKKKEEVILYFVD